MMGYLKGSELLENKSLGRPPYVGGVRKWIGEAGQDGQDGQVFVSFVVAMLIL